MKLSTRTHDTNGREIAQILAQFSEDEVAAARRLAKLHGCRIDVVGDNPAGHGWGYLRDAAVALGNTDPGRMYRNSRRIPKPAAR
jgi:hypothetical protein